MFLFVILGEKPTFVAVAPEQRQAFERNNSQVVALSGRALAADEEVKRIVTRFMALYHTVLARGSTLCGREAVVVAAELFFRGAYLPRDRMAA